MFEQTDKSVNPLKEVKKVKSAYETFNFMLKERLNSIKDECVTSREYERELEEVIDLIDEFTSGDVTLGDIVSGIQINDDNSISKLIDTLQTAISKLEEITEEGPILEDLFDFRDKHPRSVYMGEEPVSLIELAEETHFIDSDY